MASVRPIKVFVDSDVIISSLISESGAAFALLYLEEQVDLYISNFSVIELNRVVDRLKIESTKLHNVISTRFTTIKINQTDKDVKTKFADYVKDLDDAHIVAGAKEAQVAFLVSYNTRHFNTEKMREDFQIILLTPSLFMQYLRSLSP